MASLSADDWKKMIGELYASMPVPEPTISAILWTRKDYLIQPGNIFQADYEGDRYFLMNKRDLDKVEKQIKDEGLLDRPAEITYVVGYASTLAGVPVYEDSEKIGKIFMDAIRKKFGDYLTDALQRRPLVECDCGGFVTHSPNCKHTS